MVFAALDAEESGLNGSQAFLKDPPVARDAIVMNVNLDMVARDAKNVLFAAGTSHYPFLKAYLKDVAQPPVVLRLGHDMPNVKGEDDWTRDSDHYPFHQAGIPFVYFGVEDEAAASQGDRRCRDGDQRVLYRCGEHDPGCHSRVRCQPGGDRRATLNERSSARRAASGRFRACRRPQLSCRFATSACAGTERRCRIDAVSSARSPRTPARRRGPARHAGLVRSVPVCAA